MVLCFFFIILWLGQKFFTSHSPQWRENRMLLLIFSWCNNENYIIIYSVSRQGYDAESFSVPLWAIFFLCSVGDVEFLLKVGATIILWILNIMIEKSVINVLMSYRHTLSVSALLCTENLLCEICHSIWKLHFQN